MATLGMIPIADKLSVFDCGAAFLCAQKCDVSEIVRLDSGAEVEVRSRNPYVVARIRGAIDPTDAFSRAHEAVQEALDRLAILGEANLSIRNAPDEHIVWWRQDSEQVLRVVATCTMSMEMRVVETLKNKDGNPVQLPLPPKPIYDESLRYFRLSQVTEDLFDAFRNMYLAFELLLEHTCPKGDTEGESTWLRRALGEINKTVALSEIYKGSGPNVAEGIVNDLYKNIRCRLFHAKHGSRLVPQNLADRQLISDGLDKLTGIFLLLAKEFLNVRRRGGIITYQGFGWMTEPLMSGSTVLVSSNDMPLDASATLQSPPFVGAIPMSTRAAPDLSRPGLRTMLGSIAETELQKLQRLTTFGLAHNGRLIMSGNVETDLTHDGTDRVEAQMGIQLRNAKGPKELFRT
jgi:hypothetical protein